MSAEARRSWRPAFARWGGSSETDAAKAAATRRPTRLGFARIAESSVPDATRVATPAPLFELALKYVPQSCARDSSPNARRRILAPRPRALSSGTALRPRARPPS